VLTIVSGDSGKEFPPFQSDESCSPSGVIRIPVPAYQESRSQGLEERNIIVGRYNVTWRAVDGRYRQGAWTDIKSDGSSVYGVSLVRQ